MELIKNILAFGLAIVLFCLIPVILGVGLIGVTIAVAVLLIALLTRAIKMAVFD